MDYITDYYDKFMLPGAKSTPARVRFGIGMPAESGDPGIETAVGDFAPRRLRLRQQDFQNLGYTEVCGGYKWLQIGLGNRRAHTEQCRERIEGALEREDDGGERVRKSKGRMDEYAADKIKKPPLATEMMSRHPKPLQEPNPRQTSWRKSVGQMNTRPQFGTTWTMTMIT